MSGLTTHILDLTHGRPAAGVIVELFRDRGDGDMERITGARTNQDGRAPSPLIEGAAMKPGSYRLDFHIADYFRAAGVDLPDPPFLNVVSITFGIADANTHYHVPLLVSPYGYSTYRGS